MSRDDAYDDSLPIHDAHTADEVQFLVRGLHQLSVDPQAEVPADFHATVMAKAQALPLPRPRWWPRMAARLTVWAPAFAVGLVLSLGIHVWQGIRTSGPRLPGPHQAAEQPLGWLGETGPIPTYQFQVQLQHTDALGALIASRPVPQVPRSMVGFTAHAARPTYVRMGILFADTLAALQSGAVEVAQHRLDVLIQVVASLQAPPVLTHYLQEMQRVLQRPPPAAATASPFVALFEPLYAAVYATDPTAPSWVLFRAGAWLENLALAATVGDQTAVRRAQAMYETLRPLHVSDAVLRSLEQLRVLTAHQPMTPQDLHAIQTLVDTIQRQLSGEAP
jgi:hypothetical protein